MEWTRQEAQKEEKAKKTGGKDDMQNLIKIVE